MPTEQAQNYVCTGCGGAGCLECDQTGYINFPPASRRDDPETSHRAEANLNVRRRETHAALILARLRKGRVSNRELAQISLKYTGRISDLRALGHNVKCVEQMPDGTSFYELHDSVPDPEPVTVPEPKAERCAVCGAAVKSGIKLHNGAGPFHRDCLNRYYDSKNL